MADESKAIQKFTGNDEQRMALLEHTSEECTCEGKLCTKCNEVKCLGRMQTQKNKKGEIVYSTRCRICTNKYKRQWSLKNPEKVKVSNDKWRKANPENVYAKTHAEKMKAYKHEWYLANAERLNARAQERKEQINIRRMQRYHSQNDPNRYEKGVLARAKYAHQFAAWRRAHPEVSRLHCKHRKARKRNGKGKYSLLEWQNLKAFYNHTCLCCGRSEPEIKLTADHIVPLSKGGTNTIDNIQPLCFSCNSRKHTKNINYRDYMRRS